MSVPEENNQKPPVSHTLSIGANYKEIKGWIDALPVSDAEKVLQQILPVLAELDQAGLDNKLRYRILQLFGSTVRSPIAIIRKQTLSAPLPFSEKTREKAELVEQLLNGMVQGYKVIINKLATSEAQGLSKSEVTQSIYYTMTYLGQMILEKYLCYERVHSGVWIRLNGLYNAARIHGLVSVPVQIDSGDQSTIEQAYIQLLLLAAIHPLRLARGEAERVYQQMVEWSPLCNLEIPTQNCLSKNELVVHLAKDKGPYLVAAGERVEDLSETRILNIDRLMDMIQKQLEETEDIDKESSSSLFERLQKHMFLSLIYGWKSKGERVSPRISFKKPVELVVGLKDCHFILGGEHLRDGEKEPKEAFPMELDIVPEGEELVDLDNVFRANRFPRTTRSTFKIDCTTDDVWVLQQTKQLDLEQQHSSNADTYLLRQKNQSTGGIALNFEFTSGLRPSVGGLICYRIKNDQLSDWKLGAIRWMKLSSDRGTLGIQVLARNILPVYVRARQGVGKGGGQLQGLLISLDEAEKRNIRLIVPAAIYDVGTVLSVQMPSKSMRVCLTAVEDFSDSFANFSFKSAKHP